MKNQAQQNVKELLDAALALASEERAGFLARECGGDDRLRAEVEDLLRAHGAKGTFLESPALDLDVEEIARWADPDTAMTGKQVGRYHLERVIASGGMGTVYEGSRPDTDELFAIKMLRSGLVSESARRRFVHEASVLSRLDHGGIARIFDVGSHDTGMGEVPFFAMEYVRDALPVTEYASIHGLSTRARLALFIQICQAVEHGHQKSVVHRDLKPGNILVDAEGRPKVIDFGVARATDIDLAATTLHTRAGQLIGTLQYMSPEQCAGDPDDIDTRSDVYSLGVVLFELLTGSLPYDLSGVPIPDAMQIVREHPATHPSSHDRTLSGDLDTILLKALEKERERRYGSVATLADDIRRYLNDEPIRARPASAIYQFRKFARRNKGLVIGLVVAALALITGTVVAVTFGVGETKQRGLAEQREQQAQDARADAFRQADIAQTINDFLTQDLLAAVAPSAQQGKGKDVLMRDVLDEAGKRIEEASIAGGRFEGKPVIEASIRATLGETYRLLGEYSKAEPHLERAWVLRRRELGEEHAKTLHSLSTIAVLRFSQGRYDDAEPLLLKTLEIRKRALGEEDPATLRSMRNLAILYHYTGRWDQAEPLFIETLQIQKRVLSEQHPSTLNSMSNIAALYLDQDRYDEAETLFVKTLEISKRVWGENDRDTLRHMGNLAVLYRSQGRYDKAEPLFLATLEIQKRVLSEEHPSTLLSMGGLANGYYGQGRYAEAESLYLQTLEIQERVLTEEHPSTLGTMNNLAILYWAQGRFAEAEALYFKLIEIKKRVLSEEHPNTLLSMGNLASMYSEWGRYDDAEALFVKTIETERRVLSDENSTTLLTMGNLASLYSDQGRYAEAESLYLQTLEIQERVLGEENQNTLDTMGNLALLYANQRRYDEAEPLFLKTLEIQKRVRGEEHPATLLVTNNLAASLYLDQGRYDEAEPLLLATLEAQTRDLDEDHPDALQTMDSLAQLRHLQGRFEEAAALFDQVLAGAHRTFGEAHKTTGLFLGGYGKSLIELDRFEEAEASLIEAHAIIMSALGPDHKDAVKQIHSLMDLYDAWDKPEQAEQWRARLAAAKGGDGEE